MKGLTASSVDGSNNYHIHDQLKLYFSLSRRFFPGGSVDPLNIVKIVGPLLVRWQSWGTCTMCTEYME